MSDTRHRNRATGARPKSHTRPLSDSKWGRPAHLPPKTNERLVRRPIEDIHPGHHRESWHRSWSRNWWHSRHRSSCYPYVVGLVDKVDPTSCQSLPSRAFPSRPPRLRQGAQLPPLGAPASLPHGPLASNGAFHIAGVAAVAPACGTLFGKLGIASPQPTSSLHPHHERSDGRCVPLVMGPTCHIAYTSTPGPAQGHLSHRPCPAPSFRTLRHQLPRVPGKSSAT